MDWLKQSQDMFKEWMDSQQKVWDSWMTAFSDKPNEADIWGKTIQNWENSIKNMMEMQALWTRMWTRNITSNNESEGAKQFTQAVESMTKTWVETQEKLWSNWFAMARELDPAKLNETMQAQIRQGMKTWEENMGKMLETQNEWTKQWADLMQPKGK